MNLENYTKLVTTVVRRTVFKYGNCGYTEEDLVQEGLIAILRAIKTFDESKAKFETYASKIVRNRVIDILRKQATSPEMVAESNESGAVDPMDFIEKREILAQVLFQCTEVERAIFNSYFEGYSYAEIAKIFEISHKKIDNTIHKVKTLARSIANG